VHIIEYLKPGVEEVGGRSCLRLSKRVVAWAGSAASCTR